MPRIDFDSVSVDFPIYGAGKQVFKKELVRIATGGLIKKEEQKIVTVKALQELSLRITDGTRLGLIGHNGSGKSTFLRLIAGVYHPTQGTTRIEGSISSLLDIMMGIDEESTGYECIRMRGLLQGLTFAQIKMKKEEIAAFTELGDFLWMPIRTYSSGMKMRLAFAISTSFVPEILLIDEVFGTGDESFKEKAEKRMFSIIESSNIVIFTSHDLQLVKEVCNQVLWLDAGKMRFLGEVNEGIQQYLEWFHMTKKG